ncbi:thiol peroxidase [Propionicicella superfundia]|uniref:thiol peroxidase n=1 Tax=Propionicicella superfundia TaxID=348582 RepID=UPI00048DE3BA|nr:thiol peroxidase [Propionicicella superfundia]
MAEITHRGETVHTVGELPAVGTAAPDFTLTGAAMKDDVSLAGFAGRQVVLNIFPSIDTGTCALSVRTFNAKASSLDNAVVVCVSNDLPYAQARFCGAEGLDDVITASAFRSSFGDDYGVTLADGKNRGLLSRAVVVLDTDGTVRYTEQVTEIANEPDYDAALAALA